MLLSTTENIGRDYVVLGIVSGSMVHGVIGTGLNAPSGSEMLKPAGMIESSRAAAAERMLQKAAALGADAMVSVRYNSFAVTQTAYEVMAYGTAVKFR